MEFVIECRRSAGSVFGSGFALLRNKGNLVVFDDKETARAEASRLNRETRSFNLSYRAVPS